MSATGRSSVKPMNGRSGSRPQLIVAANRLPVRRVETPDGSRWETSPGGLVSALAPVLRERDDAVWVGWAGNTGPAPEPFTIDGLDLHPIGLSAANIQQYYEGFSNGTLWPLYHDAIAQPEYHRTWWDAYVQVNHRFADAIADHRRTGRHGVGPRLSAPAGVRRCSGRILPDLRIGFFLHIPFPARELFLRLPWRTQIVDGLLGADLIGFQSKVMAHNFRYTVPRVCLTPSVTGAVDHARRPNHGSPSTFPIGIDYAPLHRRGRATRHPGRHRATARLPRPPRQGAAGCRPPRLHQGHRAPADGLPASSSYEGRLNAASTVMIQIAEPSRSNVIGYAEIRAQVEQLVGEINGQLATMERPAVHYLHRSHNFDELMALYRLADVMVVTPFRDGMNLVAKEYVATRVDDTGVAGAQRVRRRGERAAGRRAPRQSIRHRRAQGGHRLRRDHAPRRAATYA